MNGAIINAEIMIKKELIIRIDINKSISVIIRSLSSTYGVEESDIIIKYNGKILDPTKSLKDYDIMDGSRITCEL